MGKHFALSFQLGAFNLQSRPRKTHSFATMGLVKNKLGVLLFGSCCLLGLAYLYQINSFSTKGFEIRSLQKDITALQEQQRGLQVQSAELQSLQRIQAQPSINQMVPVTSINYVKNSSLTQR